MAGKANVAKSETTIALENDRAVIIERSFRAPPHLVFEAWTNADFVRRWWAPKSMGAEITECRADVRPSGTYRYVTRAGETEFAFSGIYREVTPPSRLVYTMVFEPMADAGETIVTVTFEARGESTHVVSHELYPSPQAREAALASGMEDGLRVTYDQLDELVAGLDASEKASEKG